MWPTLAAPQQGGAVPAVPPTTPSGTSAIGAAASLPVVAPGQQSTSTGPTGGLQIDMGIKTSAKRDSNFSLTPGTSKGATYISDTTLTFGLSSITSAYTLQINGSAIMRIADIPGRSIRGIEDPILNALFIADSANSRLTLRARLRYVDREFLNPFQVEAEDLQSGLITNGGTLRDPTYSLKYEVGLNAPIGFVLDLSRSEKNYSGVTNPRIFNTNTEAAKGTVLLRYDALTAGRMSFGQTHYTADDLLQTDRTTRDYSIGVTRDLSQTLQLDAQIGYTDVRTDTLLGTAKRSGLTGSVGLVKTLQNGTLSGTLVSTRNHNGQRTTLSFSRSLQLKNANITATIGTTSASTGGSSIIGAVSYTYLLPSDTFTVSLNRSASTNNSNQEILNTQLSLGWAHVINTVSSVNVGLDVARTEDTGGTGAPTIQMTDLSLAYNRDLTSDWTLSSGVSYRTKTDTTKLDAHSTQLFVTLGRNFSFRP